MLDHFTSVLVQVSVQVPLLPEVLVAVWQTLAVLLNLTDLLQVGTQVIRSRLSVLPLSGFFDDLLDHVMLDHLTDVDHVVGFLEHGILTMALQVEIIKQLEPQVFQLVSIVLEEVKVVANSREDLVELLLELAVVLGLEHFVLLLFQLLLLRQVCRTCGRSVVVAFSFDSRDKAVFLGILVQFVFDCLDNAFNSGFEDLEEVVSVGLLLVVDHLCDIGIVLLEVIGWLSVVQVDQHVSDA